MIRRAEPRAEEHHGAKCVHRWRAWIVSVVVVAALVLATTELPAAGRLPGVALGSVVLLVLERAVLMLGCVAVMTLPLVNAWHGRLPGERWIDVDRGGGRASDHAFDGRRARRPERLR